MRVPPRGLLLDRRAERVDRVVAERLRSVTLVLDGVHDPHNLAAVLRTAEGLGLQDVHVIRGPSGFRPAAAVTQGADKWLDVHHHADAPTCLRALRQEGFRVHASLLADDAVPLDELPDEGKIALVFGNEHAGVGLELAAACDGRFRIPMHGFTQSFNVSVAAAMSLHAVISRRRARRGGGDLTGEDRAELRARFYSLAVKQHRRLAEK